MAEAKNKVKRGPGRPPKLPPGPHIEKKGITAPSDPSFVVQLAYHNPSIFKQIANFYNRSAVGEVYMVFTPTDLKMYSTDHDKRSKSITEIAGAEMNMYYCKAPVTICVGYRNLNHVLKNIDKTHSQIEITLREADQRSKMFISIQDGSAPFGTLSEIPLIDAAKIPDIFESQYPLEFKIKNKHLRDIVRITRPMCKTIKIEKTSKSLMMTSDRENGTGVGQNFVFDESKVVTKNTLDPEIPQAVTLQIDVIRPFAETNFAKDTTIYVDHLRQLKFEVVLAGEQPAPAIKLSVYYDIADN